MIHDCWTFNKDKVKGPDISTKFLAVLWTSEGHKFPDDHIAYNFKYTVSQGQNSLQHPIDCLHTCRTIYHNLRLLWNLPIGLLERQLTSRDDRKRTGLETACKVISEYASLNNTRPNDYQIINITCIGKYGSWELFTKWKGIHWYLPVGFSCKYFPHTENNSSFSRVCS